MIEAHDYSPLTARVFWGALLALGMVANSATAAGTPESHAQALHVAKGRVTYLVHCGNCHGDNAGGDGNMADLLTVKPSDLTRLSASRGGRFPREWIRRIIDGREQIRGHGVREMPIWGDALRESLQPTWKDVSDEERTSQKIDELVVFLESIQQGSED